MAGDLSEQGTGGISRVTAAVVAAAVIGGGLLLWHVRSSDVAAAAHDPKREAAYRHSLEYMIADAPQPMTDDEFAAALTLGYDACARYAKGLTYQQSLDEYVPGSAAFPARARPAEVWAGRVAGADSQRMILGFTLAAAARDLCPETKAVDPLG